MVRNTNFTGRSKLCAFILPQRMHVGIDAFFTDNHMLFRLVVVHLGAPQYGSGQKLTASLAFIAGVSLMPLMKMTAIPARLLLEPSHVSGVNTLLRLKADYSDRVKKWFFTPAMLRASWRQSQALPKLSVSSRNLRLCTSKFEIKFQKIKLNSEA